MYKQLTLAQRYTISTMRQNGSSYQAIADEIHRIESEAAEDAGLPPPKKRAASTIQREYERNKTKSGRYNPKTAHEMAMERRERIVTNRALKPGVLQRAIKHLKEDLWSPEQISGYLKLNGIFISKERIYQEIRRRPDLHVYCHHKMKYQRHIEKDKKPAGKSLIPDRVSIHDRPKEANGLRFGDWEMDLIEGAKHKSFVLTVLERSQSMLLQTKISSKSPDVVEVAVKRLLLPYKRWVHTITTDNGLEFRNHKAIAKFLDCTVYFADPYCSGQKGAIENANKILREFFPKGTDFNEVSQRDLDKAQALINARPRKKLGFSTPKIEFFKRIV